MSRSLAPLFLILAAHLILGTLYALFTPIWQAPDEPAHFNNIRALVVSGRLPVLQPGDYDQTYLDEIKARKFPPDMPIDSIRYEGHQPPLYYWLATPVFWLTSRWGVRAQGVALRLLGVLLGAGVIALIWASIRRLFPDQPLRAHLAAGFAAVLPMHVAMMASINNDSLSELFIALGIYRLLGHLEQRQNQSLPSSAWVLTGMVIGLALLTKFQAYILLPLAGVVWLAVIRGQRTEDGGRRTEGGLPPPLATGLAWLIPALLLPLPWWLRNIGIYGPADPLGLNRHNAIVTGQPRTVDWIAAQGWWGYLDRLVEFTFKSFWGVFGWLGVFLDQRVYTLLGLLTLLVGVGLGVWLWHERRHRQLSDFQRLGLGLLVLQALFVVGAYAWYNVDFVQHQGRYLFPALLPLSIAFALGWEGLASRQGSRVAAVVVVVVVALALALGLTAGDVNVWAMLLAGSAAAVLGYNGWVRPLLLERGGLLILVLLAVIAVYALFGAIAPQLAITVRAVI